MGYNPFEDDANWDAVDNNEQTTEKKETIVVNNSNEGKVVVTLKGGTGFDSPWIVIHAADVSDAVSQLNDSSLKGLIERASEVGSFFAGKGAKQAAPQSSAPTASPARPAGATQAPNGETKSCAHGDMTFRSGFNEQKGKAWKGFFCPERVQDCKPVFIR